MYIYYMIFKYNISYCCNRNHHFEIKIKYEKLYCFSGSIYLIQTQTALPNLLYLMYLTGHYNDSTFSKSTKMTKSWKQLYLTFSHH